MKKPATRKLLQIALLLLVLGIWGMAGYRFLKSGEEPFIEIAEPVKKKNGVAFQKSDYVLMLNYRDPFLNNIDAPEEEIEEEQTVADNAPPPPPPPPVVWPSFEYHGQLKSGKDKGPIALVTVNGKQHLLQSGEIFQGIRIVKLYLDSARFTYSGEMKTFIAN
ncbi:MAG: hypothetical protein V4616_08565 [Bacteroidota bacterium]